MDKKALRALMPKTKDDEERARYIVSLGYPEISPMAGEMLRWLRTYESPVARVFLEFFKGEGDSAADEVNHILFTSKTYHLNYIIVTKLLPTWGRYAIAKVKNSLFRLSGESDHPETQLMSIRLLLKHEVGDRDYLSRLLHFTAERMERNAAEAKALIKEFF